MSDAAERSGAHPAAAFEPLAWPEFWRCMSGFDRHVLMGLPWIGPQAHLRRLIAAQLRRRNQLCFTRWGDEPRRLEIFARLAEMIREALDWPNAYYLPEDPLLILIYSWHGDECVEVLFRLWRDFGLELSAAETQRTTLGEVVDRLVQNEQAARTATSAAS